MRCKINIQALFFDPDHLGAALVSDRLREWRSLPGPTCARNPPIVLLGHIPCHHPVALDVNRQTEIEPDALDADGEIGTIPGQDSVGAIASQPGNGLLCLGRSGPSATMALALGMEDAVEAAFRTDREVLIGQDRHDLPRRQCCTMLLGCS